MQVDGNEEVEKALGVGGRKYNYRVSSFIVTGRTEAVGTEGGGRVYFMSKREDFHGDASALTSEVWSKSIS